jgi:hypothetical protein
VNYFLNWYCHAQERVSLFGGAFMMSLHADHPPSSRLFPDPRIMAMNKYTTSPLAI